MIKRSASATWTGGLENGKGRVSTQTGVLRNAPYGCRSRFGNGPGTSPEELLAAAHAGCYSMALAHDLESAGTPATRIETHAEVTLEHRDDGFTIAAVHLACRAHVPDIDMGLFEQIAQATRFGCPLSKALNARITLDASLDG
ncbi:OsmC family protein [Dyella sp. A6]|uniref:OsmC family protein n=1 Tax=Dyella aluminiiresistens TaxID=3069105 RepID=UPI002E7638F2|nr:OsmC family protein [Dyella sp. A6]